MICFNLSLTWSAEMFLGAAIFPLFINSVIFIGKWLLVKQAVDYMADIWKQFFLDYV